MLLRTLWPESRPGHRQIYVTEGRVDMPRKNRVDPSGRVFEDASRAAELMGNRGRLHNAARKTVAERCAQKAWISCTLTEVYGKRDLDKVNTYTELFFLDEATAIAAGHRPCHDCRNADLKLFKAAWFRAQDSTKKSVTQIDEVLDRERLQDARVAANLDELPDGVIVSQRSNGSYYLLRKQMLYPWSFAGYGAGVPIGQFQDAFEVVTLPSMIRVLYAGYEPKVHSSVK